MESESPEISVVVPVYNEEPNLREVIRRTVATLVGMARSFEIIAVDDGSTDGSLALLRELRGNEPRLRIVCLARNFGQSPALYAGFAHVRGAIVAMLDADLQNPPEELPKLIAKLEEGYEFVTGWRSNRKDSVYRTLPSRLLNNLVNVITKVETRDIGCSLKVFRREIIDLLVKFTHRSRYVSVEVAWLGVRTAEVEVSHEERSAGKSKYGFLRLIRTGFDLVTGLTVAPLQFLGLVGWFSAFVGFCMCLLVLYARLVHGVFEPYAVIIATFFFLMGVQLAITGFLCEYILRTYVEAQNRPFYIVKCVIE